MSNQDFDWFQSAGTTSGGDDFWGSSEASAPVYRPGQGGWHAMLTLLCLISTTAVSFLMAWLTRDIPQRSAWLLGLTFALPAAAVMFSALFLEQATAAMTPSFSRNGQLGVSLAVVVACFIVGCFGQVTSGIVIPEPVATPTPAPPPMNHYVIALDKSASMYGTPDYQSQQAVKALVDQLPDNCYVGLVLFNDYPLCSLPMQPLTPKVRTQIKQAVEQSTNGTTDFNVPLSKAIELVKNAPLPNGEPVRILMVTDGSAELYDSEKKVLESQLQSLSHLSISTLYISNAKSQTLSELVRFSGGMDVDVNNLSALSQQLITVSQVNQPVPVSQPIVMTDVLRATAGDDALVFDSSLGITAAMLVLMGVILGVSLSIMLSRQHQFRFQLILSILCGIGAVCVAASPLFSGANAHWLREGAAFSLFGLVFMKKNR